MTERTFPGMGELVERSKTPLARYIRRVLIFLLLFPAAIINGVFNIVYLPILFLWETRKHQP